MTLVVACLLAPGLYISSPWRVVGLDVHPARLRSVHAARQEPATVLLSDLADPIKFGNLNLFVYLAAPVTSEAPEETWAAMPCDQAIVA